MCGGRNNLICCSITVSCLWVENAVNYKSTLISTANSREYNDQWGEDDMSTIVEIVRREGEILRAA